MKIFGKRRVALLSALASAALVITTLLVIQALTGTPVQVSSASVTYQGSMPAFANFTNIGQYYVGAHCPNLTITTLCSLTVSVSPVNDKLFVKSITLKLTDAPSSTLALGENTYISPPQQYTIGFGSEAINTRLITVAPSVVSPGDTWTFTVYVTNPPTTSGKLALNLEVGAQVVENRFLGKTFDLQSSLQLPNTN